MMKAYSMDEQLSPTKLMNAGLSLSLTHTYIYRKKEKDSTGERCISYYCE